MWVSHTPANHLNHNHPCGCRPLGAQEAADQAVGADQASSAAGQRGVACRVLYRLAHYADGLYRNIEAQKASPEYKTAKAVIEAKRQQVRGRAGCCCWWWWCCCVSGLAS